MMNNIIDGDKLTVSYLRIAQSKLGIITGISASDFVAATAGFFGTNASGTIASNGISVSIAAPTAAIIISAGTTSNQSSEFTFADSPTVSFGLNAGVITASAMVTAATDYAGTGFTTVTTAGTEIVGTQGNNGLSLGVPAFLTTAALSQDSSNYAGTGFTSATTAGTAIVATQGTNGLSMGIPAFLTTADAGGGITNVRVSAGTTSNLLSALTFADGGGVSWQIDASTISATVRTDYAGTGFTTVATAGTEVVGTLGTDGLSIGVPAFLTTAALSADSSKYAGTGFTSTTTAGTAVVATLSTNGLSMGIPAYLTTAAAAGITNIKVSAGTLSTLRSDITFGNDPHSTDGYGILFGLATNGVITASDSGVYTSFSSVYSMASAGLYWSEHNAVPRAEFYSQNFEGGVIPSGWVEWDAANPVVWNYTPALQGSFSAALVPDGSGATGAIYTFDQEQDEVWINFMFKVLAYPTGGIVEVMDIYDTSLNEVCDVYLNTSGKLEIFVGLGSVTVPEAIPLNTTIRIWIHYKPCIVGSSGSIGSVAWNTINSEPVSGDRYALLNNGQFASSCKKILIGPSAEVGVDMIYDALTIRSRNRIRAVVIGGNTSGTTTSISSGTLNLRGGNGVTLSQNGQSITFSVATNYLTTAALSQDSSRYAGTGFTTATTAGTAIVGTHNTAGLSMGIPAFLTTAALSQDSSKYAGVNSGATNASVTVNTSGVSVNVPLRSASLWPPPHLFPNFTTLSTYYSGSISQGAGGNSTQSGYTFSLYACPLVLPVDVAFSHLRLPVSYATSGGTGSQSIIFSAGFYTNNASTLSLVKAFYGGLFLSQNSSTAWTYSVFTASTAIVSSNAGGLVGVSAGSIQSSQGNVNSSLQLNGSSKLQRIDSGAMTTLSGGQYWFVVGNIIRSSGIFALSLAGIAQDPSVTQRSTGFLDMGVNTSATDPMFGSGWGAISTTYTSVSNAANFFAMPNAIALTDMTVNSTAVQRYHFPLLRGI